MTSTFQMTTSPSFEGTQVEAYLGVVASNVVTGTGLFSDIAAAFSDFFGGRSSAYKKQLESIREEAMREIETKARALGGNAVVSLSIDNDQISGKNTQMLMISVTATAIKLKEDQNHTQENTPTEQYNQLSRVEINHILRAKQLESTAELLSLGQIFKDYQDLFTFTPTIQLARTLIKRFLNLHYTPNPGDEETQRFLGYLTLFTYDDLCKLIYEETRHLKATEQSLNTLKLLALELNIYNESLVKVLLADNISVALKSLILVRSSQPYFTNEDPSRLQEMNEEIKNRFPVVRDLYEKKKSLGRTSIHWKCANGHENPEDAEHCYDCRLTRRDIPKMLYENALDTIEKRIVTLEEVFSIY